MSQIAAVDVANFEGTLSPAFIAACQAAGIGYAVVRLSLESNAFVAIARQQLQAFAAAGIVCGGYLWLYGNQDARTQVQQAEATYNDLACPIWWLDVEDTASFAGVPTTTANQMIAASLAEIDGQGHQAGIYTADWCWRPITGETAQFAGYPLWNADYNNPNPDLMAGFVPFGGWAAPVGKQWSDSGSVGGLTLDLDTFDSTLVLPAPVPAPDPLEARLTALEAGFGRLEAVLTARMRLAMAAWDVDNPPA